MVYRCCYGAVALWPVGRIASREIVCRSRLSRSGEASWSLGLVLVFLMRLGSCLGRLRLRLMAANCHRQPAKNKRPSGMLRGNNWAVRSLYQLVCAPRDAAHIQVGVNSFCFPKYSISRSAVFGELR